MPLRSMREETAGKDAQHMRRRDQPQQRQAMQTAGRGTGRVDRAGDRSCAPRLAQRAQEPDGRACSGGKGLGASGAGPGPYAAGAAVPTAAVTPGQFWADGHEATRHDMHVVLGCWMVVPGFARGGWQNTAGGVASSTRQLQVRNEHVESQKRKKCATPQVIGVGHVLQ